LPNQSLYVLTTVHNTDKHDFRQGVAAREDFFKTNCPKRTMVEVVQFADPIRMVEIQVIEAI